MSEQDGITWDKPPSVDALIAASAVKVPAIMHDKGWAVLREFAGLPDDWEPEAEKGGAS